MHLQLGATKLARTQRWAPVQSRVLRVEALSMSSLNIVNLLLQEEGEGEGLRGNDGQSLHRRFSQERKTIILLLLHHFYSSSSLICSAGENEASKAMFSSSTIYAFHFQLPSVH
jgi:hypothetical protein